MPHSISVEEKDPKPKTTSFFSWESLEGAINNE